MIDKLNLCDIILENIDTYGVRKTFAFISSVISIIKENNMLIEKTVNEFLYEVDSNSPAPGGGSVSALSGALGVSLVRMMQHLSFGKKKYEANDEAVKSKFVEIFENLETIKKRVIELIDEDTNAYNEVMKSFKMPKETEEEISARKEAIIKSTMLATNIPFEITKKLFEALELLDGVVDAGNQNAITDLGVGALLLQAGLEGAALNVKINLSGLEKSTAIEYENDVNKLISEGRIIRDSILKQVNSRI